MSAFESNVDDDIARAPIANATHQTQQSVGKTKHDAGRVSKDNGAESPSIGGGSRAWLWAVLILIGVVVSVQIGRRDKGPSSQYSAPRVESPTLPVADTAQLEPIVATDPEPAQIPQLVETMPPVGSGNVLYGTQIQYCLAEDIRIEAANPRVDSYDGDAVDRFNAMVADYNSRCSSFRYRAGALEGARREVEQFRGQLEIDGRSRFPEKVTATPPQSFESNGESAPLISEERALALGARDPEVAPLVAEAAQDWIEAPQSENQKRAAPQGIAGRPDTSMASSEEQAAIERACSSARQYQGPSDYYACIRRELSALGRGGRPDISMASAQEQQAIERACSSARQYQGPGAYYDCLRKEISGLGRSQRPDMSLASPSEAEAIERACSSARQYQGPAAYYECLSKEVSSLGRGGAPDISGASATEQQAIERACSSARQYQGPGAYYDCLRREVAELTVVSRPDLSSASISEQQAIERACNSARQYQGPGAYYQCLSRELSHLTRSSPPNVSQASPVEQEAIARACESARQYQGPGSYYDCQRRELRGLGIN